MLRILRALVGGSLCALAVLAVPCWHVSGEAVNLVLGVLFVLGLPWNALLVVPALDGNAMLNTIPLLCELSGSSADWRGSHQGVIAAFAVGIFLNGCILFYLLPRKRRPSEGTTTWIYRRPSK